eukprot:TRINITY_DN4368_c0_g1_i4.p3 TRINITY_DN4368_c0_g1~~TRINITY_DN4368_c0_g1_i4.p3  ORF type:complete len:239 (-),score=14.41 TRINITY_DN4368_c0_g1_i4:23-739(-)
MIIWGIFWQKVLYASCCFLQKQNKQSLCTKQFTKGRLLYLAKYLNEMYNYFLILLFCLIWIIFDVKDQQNFKQCTHALVVESSANCCGILFFFQVLVVFLQCYIIFLCYVQKKHQAKFPCLVQYVVVRKDCFVFGLIVICLLLVWFLLLLLEQDCFVLDKQLFVCCLFGLLYCYRKRSFWILKFNCFIAAALFFILLLEKILQDQGRFCFFRLYVVIGKNCVRLRIVSLRCNVWYSKA